MLQSRNLQDTRVLPLFEIFEKKQPKSHPRPRKVPKAKGIKIGSCHNQWQSRNLNNFVQLCHLLTFLWSHQNLVPMPNSSTSSQQFGSLPNPLASQPVNQPGSQSTSQSTSQRKTFIYTRIYILTVMYPLYNGFRGQLW